MKEWKKAQKINWENEVNKSGEREGGERDDRKMERGGTEEREKKELEAEMGKRKGEGWEKAE